MSVKEFSHFMKMIRDKTRDEEILKYFQMEFLEMRETGWTPFHEAAKHGRTLLVSTFIELGADINVQDEFHHTPLHWAAARGYTNIIEILVDHGARLDILNSNGLTPLDVAHARNQKEAADYLHQIISPTYSPEKLFECANKDDADQFQILFKNPYHLFIVNKKTKLTLYEILENKKCNKIIQFIRTRAITKREMDKFCELYNKDDVGFMKALEKNPLAKFVITRKDSDFKNNVCVEFANKFTALNFKYPLELMVNYGYISFIGDLHKYLINPDNTNNYIYHHEETTKISTEKELEKRNKYLKRKIKKGYTRLHIAIMDDCPDMAEYILNKGICKINDGLKTVGPPIYQCIKLQNSDCLEVLLKYKPNMNYIDKNDQSLLHLMIANEIILKSDKISGLMSNFEYRNKDGLTALHLAVIKGNKEMINLLINKDSGWNRDLKINSNVIESDFPETTTSIDDSDIFQLMKDKLFPQENVLSLNLKVHNIIFEGFFVKMKEKDVLKVDSDGDNIIHLSTVKLLPVMCEKIINVSKKGLFKQNKKGNTPLMEAIEMAIAMKENIPDALLKVIKCLIPTNDEAHFNYQYKTGKTVLQRALEAESEILMLTLTEVKPFIKKFTKDDVLFCINKKFYRFIEEHIDRFLKSSTEEAITQDVFMKVIDEAPYKCIERMYMYSNQNNREVIVENMMYSTYQDGTNMDFFNRIRKMNISTPVLLKNGETLLTFMIDKKDLENFENILSMKHCRNLVNTKNAEGYLPLHLAARNKKFDFVSSLIPYMDNINEENVKGETVLFILIRQLNETKEDDNKNSILIVIKQVIQVSGNIYLRSNILTGTPIQQCRNLNWRHKIEDTAYNIRPTKDKEIESSTPDYKKCTICATNEIDCIYKCQHKFCLSCGFKLDKCPNCRQMPTLALRISDD